METSTTLTKPPLTSEQLVDLRRRVLSGEPVSEDELRHALASLAMSRGSATASASKAEAVYKPAGSLSERFAAFKSKTEKPQ